MLTRPKSRSILVFLILSLICAGIYSWRPLIQNLALAFPHSDTLNQVAGIEEIQNYHLALTEAKGGNLASSHAHLEKLVRAGLTSSIQDRIYELYGDILYLQSGSVNDDRALYIRALEYRPSDRLRQKLALLEPTASGSGRIIPTPPVSQSSGSLSSSGQSMVRMTLDRLEQSNAEKEKYLYPLNAWPPPDAERISDIREFLQSGVERVDW